MQCAGKVVLVTGAQQGIGRAMALELLRVPMSRSTGSTTKGAPARRRGVRPRPPRAPVQADVGELDAGERRWSRRCDQVRAGRYPRQQCRRVSARRFLTMTERDWDYVLDVNLKGSCFCAQAAAKGMIAGGRSGSIINLTSGAAFRGSPKGVHYCASKGGVLSMTRQMALELAPYRIRVNAIAPGLTDTAQPRYGSSEEEIAAAGRAIPLGRIAEPEEIARAAVFLASDDAGFITGQCLHVNGGGYLA